MRTPRGTMSMTKQLQCVNIVVQLPNRRVLLSRNNLGGNSAAAWAITVERFIANDKSPLAVVNDISWNVFGVNPFNYSESFMNFKRERSVKYMNITLIPFVMKLKTALVFRVDSHMEFTTMRLDDLLEDVMANSIYPKADISLKHTLNAIQMAKELQIGRLLD